MDPECIDSLSEAYNTSRQVQKKINQLNLIRPTFVSYSLEHFFTKSSKMSLKLKI